MIRALLLTVATGMACLAFAQAENTLLQTLEKQVVDEDGNPVFLATVSTKDGTYATVTNDEGFFSISLPTQLADTATLIVQLLGFKSEVITFNELRNKKYLVLSALTHELQTATIVDQAQGNLGVATLRDIDGIAIYAGKKNELILVDQLQANLATNNPREIFKGVAGLTVWESDAAGLQLSIGARGLNPNRSSNFNTRQNGFDISADALGYPESYYTPPAQALQRIELVRGAASLQYGTQFGGLLNFKLKEGPEDRKFQVVSEQTVGSFGLLNSFNYVGGTIGKVNYYGFGQIKKGNSWRENSGFEQRTGYLDVHYAFTKKLSIGLELTSMSYLAQQPGGLLDFEFEQDPRASKRSRNWFDVSWHLAALHIDYAFNEATKLNIRNFVLDASRLALGELGPINRPDPMRERQLIDGRYRNFGQEIRFMHRYPINGKPATLILGSRIYSGLTTSKQGLASAGSDADFNFLSPESLEGYAYSFPSRNYALFAEHLINLKGNWSITPGIRYEFIRTASEGYYRQLIQAGGEVIFDRQVESQEFNRRGFVIGGLGVSYRPSETLEVYANASQNFRAINFSDLVVLNPNLLIDSTLSDERGYNAEIGFRGSSKDGIWRFDASLFYLNYDNRIGIRDVIIPDPVQIEREISMRTNIGQAALAGIEAYVETDVVKLSGRQTSPWSINPFVNLSVIHGRYLSGGRAIEGKRVELVPPLSIKSGAAVSWKAFSAQALLTHVGKQYSDATNAERVADATRGVIPTYSVVDLTASYEFKMLRLQLGVNNATDARYFTRRATGYPGPGIIPAEARSYYASVRVTL